MNILFFTNHQSRQSTAVSHQKVTSILKLHASEPSPRKTLHLATGFLPPGQATPAQIRTLLLFTGPRLAIDDFDTAYDFEVPIEIDQDGFAWAFYRPIRQGTGTALRFSPSTLLWSIEIPAPSSHLGAAAPDRSATFESLAEVITCLAAIETVDSGRN